MDNRRQPPSGPNSFNRNKPFRKEGDKPFGYGKYQNRDRNYQPRNDRFQKSEGFQNRDNFKPREGFKPRDGGREGAREGSREGFQPREGYQNREGYQKRNNQFGRRDNRSFPRGDKFQQRPGFQSKPKRSEPWKKESNIRIVSEMQVTDGKHKGKYLVASISPKAKTTLRRVREIVFKILFRRVRAKRFLDLGAGCGMVGIEAVSRGAIVSTMVEKSARGCTLIRKNLESTGIKEGHGEIVESEIVPYLKKMWKRRRFWDVVYLNPPPSSEDAGMLRYLSRGATVAPAGCLVIEHGSERFFPERMGVLRRFRVVVQGDTTISFYERK